MDLQAPLILRFVWPLRVYEHSGLFYPLSTLTPWHSAFV
ncbi:hypothetical protein ALP99_101401 [Pseudomonas syringae pv. tomato]|uniref:Uncharacterized protein n=11 Tax=Pseudomonas syringae group TaxID=136849 RepID=A0A0Q0EK56_PSESX|nr:hypothetical protein ALO87_101371 [Pseudomonas syringae pv. apii]KPW43876.1 hypothetical protein ALO88_101484 [Pseudomonas syringae pv. antirrhini]KPW52017.1 hypothetical protein ALO86_101146 [Pseudomonas syringae pv. berberidis]KPX19213.1 hypothetical protein ALO72_102019 [Pseudomonas syringae pv. delphinii]KPY13676.1 hypothetical protein ALO54_101279 [Pseudomonas syringae pv. philadelphi]KPZ14117.1 hypothetical protein ALO40_101501 [Pseudomonas syringae pv. viburni]KPZ14683.1 hypothetica